jgi:hypothetical protein
MQKKNNPGRSRPEIPLWSLYVRMVLYNVYAFSDAVSFLDGCKTLIPFLLLVIGTTALEQLPSLTKLVAPPPKVGPSFSLMTAALLSPHYLNIRLNSLSLKPSS